MEFRVIFHSTEEPVAQLPILGGFALLDLLQKTHSNIELFSVIPQPERNQKVVSKTMTIVLDEKEAKKSALFACTDEVKVLVPQGSLYEYLRYKLDNSQSGGNLQVFVSVEERLEDLERDWIVAGYPTQWFFPEGEEPEDSVDLTPTPTEKRMLVALRALSPGGMETVGEVVESLLQHESKNGEEEMDPDEVESPYEEAAQPSVAAIEGGVARAMDHFKKRDKK